MSVAIQSQFPARRMRRMRKHDFSRRLMAENTLTVNDLIYPMFILMGKNRRETVDSMSGIERLSIDLMIEEATYLAKLGVPAIALFPVVNQDAKSLTVDKHLPVQGERPGRQRCDYGESIGHHLRGAFAVCCT